MTCLIPELLQLVDDGKIALTPAVELSYLPEKAQTYLLEEMRRNDCTPSLSQAIRLKKEYQAKTLTVPKLRSIMGDEKANQKERTGRRDSVIKKDETNDTKEEKAEKEDKTEQEEKEESVPVSGSGVVQMQRESRRKERVKENARNLAKASARLAGTDGSKRTEDILQEEVQSTGTLAGNAQAMEIKGNADKESAQEDVQEEIPKEDTRRELPKDEMIRQILREFMA